MLINYHYSYYSSTTKFNTFLPKDVAELTRLLVLDTLDTSSAVVVYSVHGTGGWARTAVEFNIINVVGCDLLAFTVLSLVVFILFLTWAGSLDMGLGWEMGLGCGLCGTKGTYGTVQTDFSPEYSRVVL